MRRAERPRADEACARRQQPGDGVDRRDLERLVEGERRQIPAARFAIIVLPEPGGPVISTLCPPAAAISSARRARACPRTSAKSPCTDDGGTLSMTGVSRTGSGWFRAATASVRDRTG